MIVSVLLETWSRPTTRKVYIFSFREAGAPSFGSCVGSTLGSASGASLALGGTLSAVGSTRPPPALSTGFSQARYPATAANASTSTTHTAIAAVLPALPGVLRFSLPGSRGCFRSGSDLLFWWFPFSFTSIPLYPSLLC